MPPEKHAKAFVTTSHGEAEIGIELGSNTALHCFMPPCGGPGIFAVFNEGADVAQAIDGIKQVIELGPYQQNADLMEHFNLRGCVAVGTCLSVVQQARDAMAINHSPLKGLPQPA